MIDIKEAFSNIDISNAPMNWTSPVNIVQQAVTNVGKQIDDKVVYEIQTNIGIDVDRDRILEIMADARSEYEKGANDVANWVLETIDKVEKTDIYENALKYHLLVSMLRSKLGGNYDNSFTGNSKGGESDS